MTGIVSGLASVRLCACVRPGEVWRDFTGESSAG
jgi:hypothetical protein